MIDQTWIYGLISAALFYFLFFYKSRTTRLLEKFPKPEEQHVPILGVLPFFLNCTRSGKLDILQNLQDYLQSFILQNC